MMDANRLDDGREPGREHANLLPQMDANPAPIHAQSGREPARQVDANSGAQDANRAAEYRAEIAFLRATVEQLQRDGAETRAALREALKAMPKMITQGSEAGAADLAPGHVMTPAGIFPAAPIYPTMQSEVPEQPKRAANGADGQRGAERSNSAENAAESEDAVDFEEIESLIYRAFK